MRLQTKILALVLPLTVLPLLGLGAMAYQDLLATARQRSTEQMTGLLGRVRADLQSRVQTLEANVTLFSNTLVMKKYAITTDDNVRYRLVQPAVLSMFRTYLQAYPDYREVRFLLLNGYEDVRSARSGLPNATEEEGDTEFFQALRGYSGSIYSTVIESPDDHRPVLIGGKPVRLTDPSVDPVLAPPVLRGYLTVTMDLDYLEQVAASSRIGENGVLFFTDAAGKVLFHRGTERVRDGQLPADLCETLWKLATSGAGTMAGTYQGEDALWGAVQVHNNLYAVTSVPDADLTAAGRGLRTAVIGVTLVAGLLAGLLTAATFNHFLVGPIDRLYKGVRAIQAGNLRPHLDIDSNDEIGELARAFEEMGESVLSSAKQVRDLAFRDNLTGLPNRHMFSDYLARALARAGRQATVLALLFLDMDDFKRINDTLGHRIGDLLLKEMAERLQQELREEDFVVRPGGDDSRDLVARLGGDEFIVVLPAIPEPKTAGQVAQRLIAALAQPFHLEGHPTQITVSIGITLFPDDGDDPNALIKNADAAMYHAKSLGKNTFQFYAQYLNEIALKRLAIENGLRNAIERGELHLVYQPMLNVKTLEIIGLEALARWVSPELGVVMPERFLAVVEDSGLFPSFGEWVLREACRQNKLWQDAGLPKVPVGVNITETQCEREELPSIVGATLAAVGLEPGYLILELRAKYLSADCSHFRPKLAELRAMGVHLALDDFGTGHASLNHLRDLPIDKVKIDHWLVAGIAENKADAAIVRALLALAHNLGLETIAEGVETIGQWAMLREQGCETVQGFMFGRPLPAASVDGLLAAGTLELPPLDVEVTRKAMQAGTV